jgi:hypothetical protein
VTDGIERSSSWNRGLVSRAATAARRSPKAASEDQLARSRFRRRPTARSLYANDLTATSNAKG